MVLGCPPVHDPFRMWKSDQDPSGDCDILVFLKGTSCQGLKWKSDQDPSGDCDISKTAISIIRLILKWKSDQDPSGDCDTN